VTQTLAEVLLLVSVATNATLLIFIAGVLRSVMSDMDGAAFKLFVGSLVRHSKRSPFMLTALNVPFVGAIPYFYFYGFGNRWILAGLVLWLVAGSVAKIIKLPVYKTIDTLDAGDVTGLSEQRKKLDAGNLLQAILDSVAVALMMIAFIK
jgi:hypothetical protein